MSVSWDSHFKNFDTKKYPPATTLIDALKGYRKSFPIKKSKLAIDLGCGSGTDTFALLGDNWNVVAIDKQKEALLRIKENVADDILSKKLQLRLDTFENIKELPVCELINATFSLPFCNPTYFSTLWKVITSSIKSKGVFCGHFFGVNDSWCSNSEMTFHTKQQVFILLQDFDVEYCKEVEKNGKTLSGIEKHWHIFYVVAKKK